MAGRYNMYSRRHGLRPPSYPWIMLIDDYTSVPSWQACGDSHIVLTSDLVKASVS
jgi:hypothetical protein